jgi:hypothetical protein
VLREECARATEIWRDGHRVASLCDDDVFTALVVGIITGFGVALLMRNVITE